MDEHQIEIAARKLCALRGDDPDEVVGHGPDFGGAEILLYSKRWQRAAIEVKRAMVMREAIDCGEKQ